MRHKAGIRLLVWACALIISIPAFSQDGDPINLRHADDLFWDQSLPGQPQRLIGNVRFTHQGAHLFCDSAYLYEKTNSIKAYGRVLVKQGDTLQLNGDTLIYDGNTSKASLRGNIRMVDKDMELTTNFMDFDRASNIASYQGGGKIISRTNRNVLTSKEGYFNTATEEVHFKDSVVMHHPKYDIYSDTLRYDTKGEIVYFLGPTQIVSEGTVINTTNGWYNTTDNTSQFLDHSKIVTGDRELEGDTLFYNQDTGDGTAIGNIMITDTINDVVLTGNYAEYNEQTQEMMITGDAVFTQVQDGDSLHMHSDTLVSMKDSTGQHQLIKAWYHVKFFKEDLQGKCDSLSWSEADSSMRLYRKPVLWSEENQLSGDHIIIKTWQGQIRRMNIDGNAFIISEHDSIRYNQIKGLNMEGKFNENELRSIFLEGNGQTIYWAEEEKKDSVGEKVMRTIGMNDAVCSDILIKIKEKKIQTITFIKEPTAILYPLKQLPDKDLFLDGFEWFGRHRPMSKEEIFFWHEDVVVEEESPESTQ